MAFLLLLPSVATTAAAVVGSIATVGSIAYYRYYHTGDQARCCPIKKRTILLLGASGAGKSTMLNRIFKTTIFEEGHCTGPHTYDVDDTKPYIFEISGSCFAVTAIDTRGFLEQGEGSDEIDGGIEEIKERVISMGGDIHAIFLVFDGTCKLGVDYRNACKAIAKLLNAKTCNATTTCNAKDIIHMLITHSDQMDHSQKKAVIDEFLNHSATEQIKPLIKITDGTGHHIHLVSFDKAPANSRDSVNLIRDIIIKNEVGIKVDTVFN